MTSHPLNEWPRKTRTPEGTSKIDEVSRLSVDSAVRAHNIKGIREARKIKSIEEQVTEVMGNKKGRLAVCKQRAKLVMAQRMSEMVDKHRLCYKYLADAMGVKRKRLRRILNGDREPNLSDVWLFSEATKSELIVFGEYWEKEQNS